MRQLLGSSRVRKALTILAISAGFFGPAAAEAGPLINAQFQLVFSAFGFGPVSPAVFTVSGPLAGWATGTGSTAAWSVGPFSLPNGTLTALSTSALAPPITQIQFIINGNPATGSFGASVNGNMAVTGVASVKAYGGSTLLGVPVTVGAPSVITPPLAAGIGITAYANAWTTKTTTIDLTRTTLAGGTPIQGTAMGSNSLVNGGGTVVLVTALNMLTSLDSQLPSFSILVLQYAPDSIPEPGTLALFGLSILGLGVMGRLRQRK